MSEQTQNQPKAETNGERKHKFIQIGAIAILLISLTYIEYLVYKDTNDFIQDVYRQIAESDNPTSQINFLAQPQEE